MRALRSLRREPLDFLAERARQGDVAAFRLGRQRVLLLGHPRDAYELLVTQNRRFVKENVILAYALRRPRLGVRGGYVMSNDTSAHVRARRAVQPAFGGEAVDRARAIFEEEAAVTAGRWRAGSTTDVAGDLELLVLRATARALFSLELDGEAESVRGEIERVLTGFAVATSRPRELSGIVRIRRSLDAVRAHEALHRRMSTVLERREPREDVPGLLAAAFPPGDALAADALGVLVAGADTTARALAWALWLLAGDDALYGRVASGSGEDARTAFAETLRLYPPSWYIGRRAVEPATVAGVELAPGDVALVSPYLIHRDARFFDDPQSFRPERWADEDAPAAFLPFGRGPRRCLGERLAWAAGPAALRALAERWRLRRQPGHRVVAEAAASLRPRGGLPMIPEPHP